MPRGLAKCIERCGIDVSRLSATLCLIKSMFSADRSEQGLSAHLASPMFTYHSNLATIRRTMEAVEALRSL